MNRKPVLLKEASNKQELTNWENILITKNKDHIINFETLPADNLSKKFILNLVEGSRSAPTRIPNQYQLVCRLRPQRSVYSGLSGQSVMDWQ